MIIVVNQTKKNHTWVLQGIRSRIIKKKNYMSSYKVTRILPHEGHGLFVGLKFN
jgi:hypothetical protein